MTDPTEVLVVGGGLAGLLAACVLAEAGSPVRVFERGTEPSYPCNTRYSGGAYHVAYRDVLDTPAALYDAIRQATRGHAQEDLTRALAGDALRAVRWLQARGVKFIKGPETYQHWLLAPPRASRPGPHWAGRAGDTLLRTLERTLAAAGGRLERGATARNLIMEDGRCAGVEVERDGESEPEHVAGEAVVLADGGFQGAPELLRLALTAAPEKLVQRGPGTGRGSGLAMARAAGAKLTDLEAFYGHLLSRDAIERTRLSPWPTLDALAAAAVVVDRTGERFTDEGAGGIAIANAVARLEDPLSATVVFDQQAWMGTGTTTFIPANPHLVTEGATIHRADTLPALAEQAGLPAERLEQTVLAHNAAAAGHLREAHPPRTGAPLVLDNPPYYAVPICCGITYTMGGIAVDGNGRVIDREGRPIAGLWAAGSTTGGLEGGPARAYVGGLARAAVGGLRAAESILRARVNEASDEALF